MPVEERLPVYEICYYSEETPTSYNPDYKYVAWYGLVRWESNDPNDLREMLVFLRRMPDGQINVLRPAHIIPSDWPAVRALGDRVMERVAGMPR